MKENKYKASPTCAFCGSELIWDSDCDSEDCGYDIEGKIVSFYRCPLCGATAEFCENLDEEHEEN